MTATPETADLAGVRATVRKRRSRGSLLLAFAVPMGLLVLWWWTSRSARPVDLPAPGLVLQRTWDLLFGIEADQSWTSFARIIVAVVAALLIGAVLVALARVLPVTESLVGSIVLPFLNSVPALGWAILGVVWFGVSNTSVIFVLTLILIPFCMVNLWEGLRALDPGLQEMGRSFTRSSAKLLVRVQSPMLIPYALAAVRLSFSVGWKVALIAEFFGAEAGLGLVMNRARQSFDTATVFATVIVVLIVVTVAERAIFDPLARIAARRAGTGAI